MFFFSLHTHCYGKLLQLCRHTVMASCFNSLNIMQCGSKTCSKCQTILTLLFIEGLEWCIFILRVTPQICKPTTRKGLLLMYERPLQIKWTESDIERHMEISYLISTQFWQERGCCVSGNCKFCWQQASCGPSPPDWGLGLYAQSH